MEWLPLRRPVCAVRWKQLIGKTVMVAQSHEVFVGRVHAVGLEVQLAEFHDVHAYFYNVDPHIFIFRTKSPSNFMVFKCSDVEHVPLYNRIQITKNEFDEMWRTSSAYKFIDKIDQKYHDAVQAIRQHDKIGIVCFSCAHGPGDRLSLLAVATPLECYIFDMLSIGRMHSTPDFRQIFASSRQMKIIHDAKEAAKLFLTTFDVVIENVFDTLLLCEMVCHDSLPWMDFIVLTMNLPGVCLAYKPKYFSFFDPNRRPFEVNDGTYVAKRALAILKTYECIPRSIIPADFEARCADNCRPTPSNLFTAHESIIRPEVGI